MEVNHEIEMTALPKTWILDLDGTIVKHNGYKLDGVDSLLDGAKDLLAQISDEDMIIFVTSRTLEYKESTERFLQENGIRFDHIIYGAPYGERILINDSKPSGRIMAYAIAPDRDKICSVSIHRNENL